jgi:hypothetical protein
MRELVIQVFSVEMLSLRVNEVESKGGGRDSLDFVQLMFLDGQIFPFFVITAKEVRS